MDYMNSLCTTVYLKASPEVLASHLRMGRTVRPLIVGKTDEELVVYIRDMLKEREPFYNRAQHVFVVDLLETRERVGESVRLLMDSVLTLK